MPKFGIHMIVGEKAAVKLQHADALANRAPLRLGAVGPDLTLFLMDQAQDNPVASAAFDGMKSVMSTYRELRQVADKISEFREYAGGPVEALANWYTGGAYDSALETIGLSIKAFSASLKVMVFYQMSLRIENPFEDLPKEALDKLFGADLPGWIGKPTIDISPNYNPHDILSPCYVFRYFGSPYTNDPPIKTGAPVGDYSDWWWMDILHYRRTVPFALKLKELATTPVMRSYALGYMSHVAADITGHPYINTLVGGGFRNHALRHMVVEGLVDVKAWARYIDGDAALRKSFGREDRPIRPPYVESRDICNARLDQLISLSNDEVEQITQLLHAAMHSTYVAPPHGGRIATKNFGGSAPTPGDLRLAYEAMMGYLAMSTDVGLVEPTPPSGSPGEIWDELRSRLQKSFDKVGQFAGDLRNAEGWDILVAVLGLALWALVVAIQIMTLPTAIMAQLMALAPQWVLYLINYHLYLYVREVRYAMALAGWGYASKADLDRDLSKRLLSVPTYREKETREGRRAIEYPFAMAPRVNGFWLESPASLRTLPEEPLTHPGPYVPGDEPWHFMESAAYDRAHDAELKSLSGQQPITPAATTERLLSLPPGGGMFGNSVDFTLQLYTGQYPPGSFDLDGDRGYGQLQWQKYPPDSEYLE